MTTATQALIEVGICLGRHTVPASAVNLLDVLQAANRQGDRPLFRTRLLAGATTPETDGVRWAPDAGWDALAHCDLVLVPAFRAPLDEALADQAMLIEQLPACLARGQRVASACAGALLLAQSGVLDGRRATTHWRLVGVARQRFGAVRWQQHGMVEDDGPVLTSAGGTAALDLALHLVAQAGGTAMAQRVASGLLFDPHRGPQARYFPITPQGVSDDPLVAQAQQRLFEQLDAPPAVTALARSLHVTPRTLLRRFRAATGWSLQTYTQRLRLDAARDLLSEGRLGVEAAMQAVGYTDRASFSRAFTRLFGQGPGAVRRAR